MANFTAPDLSLDGDTIVAIATPPGRGGIGIVRLSGPASGRMMLPVLSLESVPAAREAVYTQVVDPAAKAVIDEAIVTFFAAPNSYTGEDVLEIAAHGSPPVLAFLVQQALARGARLARPGEFTQRAFLSRRLDLTQAEAVRDLIDASTLHQARLAAEQLGGGLSRSLAATKRRLLHLIAALEAGIDFAEDDIDILPDPQIHAALDAIAGPLEALARSFRYGRLVHGGLTLAIVGPPNVGKSSLFNRLLDRDRAIVTATPGTTRDPIAERVAIGGIPVELIDTAGLRVTTDEAEAMGIARTHEALATADLVLHVTEARTPPSVEDEALLASLAGRTVLRVSNKADLLDEKARVEDGRLHTSALTGDGIDRLREAIAETIRGGALPESGLLTNLRQHEAVTGSLAALAGARAAVENRIPHEMLMMNLYAILEPLDELTGTTTPDDILNLIFSTFCIGK